MLYIGLRKTVLPKVDDVFDPSDPWFGNSNLRRIYDKGDCDGDFPEGEIEDVDWIYANHAKLDLRMAYLECKDNKIV